MDIIQKTYLTIVKHLIYEIVLQYMITIYDIYDNKLATYLQIILMQARVSLIVETVCSYLDSNDSCVPIIIHPLP